MTKPQKLDIDKIRIDGGTQVRSEIDNETVAEYAEAMEEGDEFPSIVVFHDGSDYWLGDGFHRYHATRRVGFVEIMADVRKGTLREARRYAIAANRKHGKRMTNADKRHAVTMCLEDAEWATWSDREIARECGVSNRFASNIRAESASVNDSQIPAPRKVRRNGVVYEQNTENIGKKPEPEPEAEPLDDGETRETERSAEQEGPKRKPKYHGRNADFPVFCRLCEEISVAFDGISDLRVPSDSATACIGRMRDIQKKAASIEAAIRKDISNV